MPPRGPQSKDRLSDSDAIMWRIESDPVLRSPILAVALLGSRPRRAAVTRALERATDAIPRLRCRVVPDGPVTGRLRWEEDPDFHLAAHVRERRLSGSADLDDALALVAEDAAAAFDPARPPWTATLISGLPDRKAVLALRFHHSMTDGVGGVQLAGALFDPVDRETDARSADGPAADIPAKSGPGGLVGFALGAGRVATTVARDPLGLARDAARTARSVRKLLSTASEPLSPLWTHRGIDRRLFVTEVPLEALHVAGSRWGASINDVYLAAIAGGLHRYHQELGHEVPALRFTMPVNRRSADDAPGGNRFTPVRFVLPIDDPDLEQRARIAGNVSRSWRTEPSVGFTDLLASALNRLPEGVLTGVFAGMLRGVDVDAVDVPGLREPVALAGAPVERLWAFAPPAGAALSITLLSHLDLGCIAIEVDLAAVAEPERLVDALRSALDEAVATASPAGAGRPR